MGEVIEEIWRRDFLKHLFKNQNGSYENLAKVGGQVL